MTKVKSLFIKYLRIRCDGSWRWVSEEYCKRYPNEVIPNGWFYGHQMHGKWLCDTAQELLNEHTIDNNGWN